MALHQPQASNPFLGSRLALGGPRSLQKVSRRRKARIPAGAPAAMVPPPAAMFPAPVPAPAAMVPAPVPAPTAMVPAPVPAPTAMVPSPVLAPAAMFPAPEPAHTAMIQASVPVPTAMVPTPEPTHTAMVPAPEPAHTAMVPGSRTGPYSHGPGLCSGDLIAIEAKYNHHCLRSLYNRARQAAPKGNEGDDSCLHGIAFAELVAYLEDMKSDEDSAPVFKLTDIACTRSDWSNLV
ncbi:hypothetical protein F7725_022500 [Dissostichus mawsoni]|uniref:Uncharacterized protein n=1 Tax=Dissostichus mawsoni TaxID=36200 RepID=A0A7J5YY43_DISMA|nr:hypothetical protein F7725_022500 [Dissostichus mawsoni]